ncbi:MAG: hypothetical protein HYV14_10830 [Elusimicrobia bacterium]|nr:hypothetical protein [Elusimicrobiota bacterium]
MGLSSAAGSRHPPTWRDAVQIQVELAGAGRTREQSGGDDQAGMTAADAEKSLVFRKINIIF